HVALIIGAVVGDRPAKRVALDTVARIAVGRADLIAVGVAAEVAEAALELLGEIARRLLQLVQRLALRADRLPGLAMLQRAGGIAHRALGAAKGLGDVAHAVAELAHHFAEHAAQPLLLTGLVAHLAAVGLIVAALRRALLALLPPLTLLTLLSVAVLLALGAEALVEKLLLLLHQFLQATH